jgi:hypothetical protein
MRSSTLARIKSTEDDASTQETLGEYVSKILPPFNSSCDGGFARGRSSPDRFDEIRGASRLRQGKRDSRSGPPQSDSGRQNNHDSGTLKPFWTSAERGDAPGSTSRLSFENSAWLPEPRIAHSYFKEQSNNIRYLRVDWNFGGVHCYSYCYTVGKIKSNWGVPSKIEDGSVSASPTRE